MLITFSRLLTLIVTQNIFHHLGVQVYRVVMYAQLYVTVFLTVLVQGEETLLVPVI